MSVPVLYSFRRCPYAMRARLALQASGVEVELREVLLRDKPAQMLQSSAKGTVPVLVQTDGQVIDQSLDIMLWALRHNDPQQWLPASVADLEDALRCIGHNDGAFKQALDRYKYPARFGLADGLVHRDAGSAYLRLLAQRLAHQPFLNGVRWGFLDAAVAPFARQFAHTDAAWFAAQDWPVLTQWLQGFEDSAAFQAIMEKAPVWTAGDTPHLTRFAVHA